MISRSGSVCRSWRVASSASVISARSNDLSLIGTLAGVEMGLRQVSVAHTPGGVRAAMDYLAA